ncbi:hypothetical protein [Vibrio mimicus]|uniref:hypothetical protein n=1 Tax=Vibrio mimicus TaxID=674 RepID=UPI0011D9741C|nr:hypothetical protein [Vibrio mimicus]TXY45061.1 hypothetical protein FXE78_17395 [Vibrio mimicus]
MKVIESHPIHIQIKKLPTPPFFRFFHNPSITQSLNTTKLQSISQKVRASTAMNEINSPLKQTKESFYV